MLLPFGSHFGQCSLSQIVESDSSVSDFLLIDAQTELVIGGQLKVAEQLGHANANGSQLLYLRFKNITNPGENYIIGRKQETKLHMYIRYCLPFFIACSKKEGGRRITARSIV